MSTSAIRPTATGEPGYSQVLACRPEAASAARRLVSTALETWRIRELCSDAELIASELATNAVLHSGVQTFRFEVQWLGDGVRISAEDSASDRLAHARDPNDKSTGGRGLLLVKALCLRWGCDSNPRSKTVWAELRAPGAEG
ncbi:ATP-binding protein [Streptomyces uncialis]|uniref:ATP-binding protein n=1 Tax=Streptomyces uncialis TaxID=1048205 RepID=UPI00386E544D|nr:ATP-binding protein [Streptomyces uncialis]